ncbi:MAG: hypothetical protein ABW133_14775 [Polyangiaceae bacterium]
MRCPRSGLLAVVVVVAACGAAENREDATSAPIGAVPDAAPIASFTPRCVDGEWDRHRHGSTCLCCHTREFGVAGSVDPSGAPVERIVVTDATGDVASMAPNLFANFFRHFKMTPPFRAIAYGPDGRAAPMRADAPTADCNVCHYVGGPVGLVHGP